MSRTPIEANSEANPYRAGWASMGWLLRQGQSWSGHEPNSCFLGKGDGHFYEVGGAVGLAKFEDGRSVARVDWDQDGDLDLIMRSRSAPRLRFMENRMARRGNYVAAKLVAKDTSIGARLEVRGGAGAPWLRTLRAGEGYLSQSSEWLHIGVSQAGAVDLQVIWPGGERESFGEVPTSKRYVLVQGEGQVREGAPPEPFVPVGDSTDPEAADIPITSQGRLVLGVPHPLPRLTIETYTGKSVSLGGILESRRGERQKPVLLMLWSADCAPCLKELSMWSATRTEFDQEAWGVVALEVAQQRPSAPGEWLTQAQWPFAKAVLPESSVDQLEALTQYVMDSTEALAVPTSFLLDSRGRVQVIYRGAVDVETVEKDLAMFALNGPERLRLALPFDGLYLDPPKEPNWQQWAQFVTLRGLDSVAEEIRWGFVSTEQAEGAEAQFRVGEARMRQGRYEEALPNLERALEGGPNIPRYLQAVATCLRQLDRGEDAIPYLETSLLWEPKDTRVLLWLGMLQAQKGELWAARRTLGTLTPLSREYSDALLKLIESFEAKAK